MPSKSIQHKLIAALQISKDDKGNECAGVLTQVNVTPEMKICGDGFNERTIKISLNDCTYYVFKQDLFYLDSVAGAINSRFAGRAISTRLQ
ncbi:MAG TPA: hypothetical protein VN633_13535 [Bryobacteraceae bacterium]|nr:hypothetical protein [Bryobacteraceae bacterium]